MGHFCCCTQQKTDLGSYQQFILRKFIIIEEILSLAGIYHIRSTFCYKFMLSEHTETLRSNVRVRCPKRPNKTQNNTQKSMKILKTCQISDFNYENCNSGWLKTNWYDISAAEFQYNLSWECQKCFLVVTGHDGSIRRVTVGFGIVMMHIKVSRRL